MLIGMLLSRTAARFVWARRAHDNRQSQISSECPHKASFGAQLGGNYTRFDLGTSTIFLRNRTEYSYTLLATTNLSRSVATWSGGADHTSLTNQPTLI